MIKKEIFMNSFLKDLSILLFSVGEEIENKAKEFKEEREQRYKEFEEKIKDRKEEFKEKHGEEMEKIRKRISEFSGKLGLATKDEIDEIKAMLAELNTKIDNLKK
jgi:polyhydroxyalkanoate synthesis regulator phasin